MTSEQANKQAAPAQTSAAIHKCKREVAVRKHIDVEEECIVSGTAPCQGRLDAVHTASQRLDRSTQGYLAGLTQLEMSLRCLHCLLAAFNIWFFNIKSPKALVVQLELAGCCTGENDRAWDAHLSLVETKLGSDH
jgi:hypothetical protein